MRQSVGIVMVALLAQQCLWAEPESRKYYLTEHHWNHLVDSTFKKEGTADPFEGEEEKVAMATAESVMGSRLTAAGLKISNLKLLNRWEAEISTEPDQHDRLARVLEFFDQELYVYIQVKAYSVGAESLKEVGLKEAENPYVFPIANREKYEELIRRVNSTVGSEILSAPSVVAQGGQSARVELVREFIYPSNYDPPKFPSGEEVPVEKKENAPPTEVSSFPVTPSAPSSFESRNLGLAMEFLPILKLDGTVELGLDIENVLFEGFVNYGSPIQTPVKTGLFKKKVVPVTLTENRMEMPIFNRESYKGSVDIPQETYFVVGGLNRQKEEVVEEKKLFKKKTVTVQTSKPTFYIVSARIIDKEGKDADVDVAMLGD